MLVSKITTACCVSFMLSLSAAKNSRKTSTKSSCTHLAWSSNSQALTLHAVTIPPCNYPSWVGLMLCLSRTAPIWQSCSSATCPARHIHQVQSCLVVRLQGNCCSTATCVNVVKAATAGDFVTVTKQSCNFFKSAVLADPCWALIPLLICTADSADERHLEWQWGCKDFTLCERGLRLVSLDMASKRIRYVFGSRSIQGKRARYCRHHSRGGINCVDQVDSSEETEMSQCLASQSDPNTLVF